MNAVTQPKKYHWIPLCFIWFFLFIFVVDGYFVYTAITTNTGVVTENAYEKGLNYNALLSKARHQPTLREKISYENNVLRWEIATPDGVPLQNASVHAVIKRPVHEKYDFELPLQERRPGIYEVKITLPLKGQWTAKLRCEWDKKEYRTKFDLMEP